MNTMMKPIKAYLFIYNEAPTSIKYSAFQYCGSLTSVTIPDSVTSIGTSAFYDCSSLTSVTIGNSVTSIGDGAFGFCDSLTSVIIPESVTSIGYGAFSYCSSLTSITIPDSVTSIGEFAFEGCSSLISIEIPYSVTSIGSYAFEKCYSLTFLYCKSPIPSNLTGILSSSFINKIYIPIDSLSEYQNATNWSQYADIMVGSEILSLSDDSLMGISISLEERIKHLAPDRRGAFGTRVGARNGYGAPQGRAHRLAGIPQAYGMVLQGPARRGKRTRRFDASRYLGGHQGGL